MKMKHTLLIMMALFGGMAVQAAEKPAEEVKPIKPLERAASKKLNVAFKVADGQDVLLDYYGPSDKFTGPRPVIFYTHGGGWATGSKRGVSNASFGVVFNRLLDNGFAVVTIEYRLVKKDGTSTIRDCVIDSKDAVRFIAKNAKEYNIDPKRCFALGDSAGGQLAQMLILAPPKSLPGAPELADVDYNMVSGVSWYGPCDFEKTELYNHDNRPNFRNRFGARIFRGKPSEEERLAMFREVSPINYMTANSPGFLMIQGDKDTTIPVKHAYYLEAKAKELNVPLEVMIIKNAGHNFREVGAKISPTRNDIIDRTVGYLTDRM
jgi:acetyl esterase/lipase